MRHALAGAFCLLVLVLAPVAGLTAQTSPEAGTVHRTPDTDAPVKTPPSPPAVTMQQDGVIHPPPDATADSTVKPPNVDPRMTIPPPGTPGSDAKVVPK